MATSSEVLQRLTESLDVIGEDYVFEEVLKGVGLRGIARSLGVSIYMLRAWIKQSEERETIYLALREIMAEASLDEIVDIANEDPVINIISGTVDAGWVAHQRLRIDTVKWTMGKHATRLSDKAPDKAVVVDMGNIVEKIIALVRGASSRLQNADASVIEGTATHVSSLASLVKR